MILIKRKKIIIIVIVIIAALSLGIMKYIDYYNNCECDITSSITNDSNEEMEYGVFLSIDNTQMERLESYKTVVIDADYFTQEDIEELHEDGKTVYSYLNIGSLEDFRDYYEEFEDITLGDYENWDEEKWIDVSNEEWQNFILELSQEYIEMGIDGFFIDNCDVYYVYNEESIYEGITNILTELVKTECDVIINGGDTYVMEYLERNGEISEILTGVNQETVFSSIDFDTDTFGTSDEEDFEYFTNYIETVSDSGADIFLLEYTTDESLKEEIANYCEEKGFKYYISDSIELE